MVAKDNIVPLDAAQSNRAAPSDGFPHRAAVKAANTRRMSAPAVQLKEFLHRQLSNHLQALFDKVDDALFDLAEHAPNNQQQNMFFESMREVRFKRVEVEQEFLNAVQSGFVDLFNIDKNAEQFNASLNSAGFSDALALLEEDLVEEMVAIDSMVLRFEKLLSEPLLALNERLAHLADYHAVGADAGLLINPISPKNLCHYFSDACRMLGIDIKSRIVLFKLFEKIVLSDLDQVYKQSNEKLIQANILPQLPIKVRRTSSPALNRQDQIGSSKNTKTAHSAQQAQELAQLMSYVPEYGSRLPCNAVDPLADALQSLKTSNYPAIGSEVLLQLLHSLQQGQAVPTVVSANCATPPRNIQRPDELLINLANKLAACSDNQGHSIGQGERDVIGLVSMLFQLVIEDRVVSGPMKAAISRLQIPIIKVALNESNFFCTPSHPARRLLNEMTQAVVGWEAADNYHTDPLYQIICSTVERVAQDYTNDSTIFLDVMADLKSWIDDENKRIELRKKRLIDAESGRDESASARAAVKRIIEQNLTNDTPEFIVVMLEGSWSNLLFLAYLQQGQESEQWHDALITMQQLLWTVAPQRTRDDRAELLAQLPNLLQSLRQGIDSINHDKCAVGDFFEKLEKVHMQVMQRPSPAGDTQLSNDRPHHRREEQKMGLGDQTSTVTKNGLLVAAVSQANTQTEFESHQPLGPYQKSASELAVGQWVELIEDNKKKRCRLVAVLRNSGKRIFINRTGSKAAELDVNEIAQMLESGEMLLLENAQLFDKALTSIIDGLRKQRHAAESA
jgi:hypothetical protein